jgi:hypothetical protein
MATRPGRGGGAESFSDRALIRQLLAATGNTKSIEALAVLLQLQLGEFTEAEADAKYLPIVGGIGEVETLTGTTTEEAPYEGTGSFQHIGPDLVLGPDAGNVGTNPKFLAPIMGNVIGATLTKAGAYISGLIGALSVSGARATLWQIGAVLGIVMDGTTDADGAVVAVIDGDDPSSETRARAAFAVAMNNNNAASGVDYGLDLKDEGRGALYSDPGEGLPFTISKAIERTPNDVCRLEGDGVPVDYTDGDPVATGEGFAGKGSLYTDYTNGTKYTNTGTKAEPVWSISGLPSDLAGLSTPIDPTALASLSGEIGPQIGSALYGDGSDGDIVVDSSTFDLPSLVGISAWQVSHAYAVGDLVKSTGTNVRVFRCARGGTSRSDVDPLPDALPGGLRRGDRTVDVLSGASAARVIWEQETTICKGVVEGPIFADNLSINAGVTLSCAGWPLYARGTATVAATAIISGNGVNAAGPVRGTASTGFTDPQTLLGRGVDGADSNGGGAAGSVWGGGIGGDGGLGADHPTYEAGVGLYASTPVGFESAAYTLGRRSMFTLFTPFFWNLNSSADTPALIGSPGGFGSADTGAGKLGGASGSCASAIAIFAKTLIHNGAITAKGGNGGNAEAGGDTGGGGGSSGGCIVLIYGSKTGTGTVDTSGGAGGLKQGAGTNGTDGSPGDFVEFVNA